MLDLNNYKRDALHYGQWINDAITECIARGENVVADRDTLDEATAQLRAWADAQIGQAAGYSDRRKGDSHASILQAG